MATLVELPPVLESESVTAAKIRAASEIVQQYGAEGVENIPTISRLTYQELFKAAAEYLQGVFEADVPVTR